MDRANTIRTWFDSRQTGFTGRENRRRTTLNKPPLNVHGQFSSEADGPSGNSSLKYYEESEITDPDVVEILRHRLECLEKAEIIKIERASRHGPVFLVILKPDIKCSVEQVKSVFLDNLDEIFDNKEIRLKIKKLDEERKAQFKDYAGSLKKKSAGIGLNLNNGDEQFMKRVIEVIQEHLDNNEFTIERLSSEVGLCRSQLYRKIKALTGISPSRLINSVRLSCATEMIRSRKGNISEIAYAVGFSSPVYFSRCFKYEFGFPPSSLLTMNDS